MNCAKLHVASLVTEPCVSPSYTNGIIGWAP